MLSMQRSFACFLTLSYLASTAIGQQPPKGTPGGFKIVAETIVSAQQMFLGTDKTVYILDKVEDNPARINDHPVWAQEFSLASGYKQRPMEVVTNTFCAGGNSLGNGTWLNIGGNRAVKEGGWDLDEDQQNQPSGTYKSQDGRMSIRLLDPCDDESCQWIHSPVKTLHRWYPTIETLEDGSVFILGGDREGGYVNNASQNEPTFQIFPPKTEDNAAITVPILERSLPANLFCPTFLLPSGLLFIQANWATALYDYKTQVETPIDDIPDAVRTYPASAAIAMLPLTPANNWTATILFCGGSDIQADRWTQEDFIVSTYPASDSCVNITPDVSGSYVQDEPLPEIRVMGNMILLPNGKALVLNGAKLGTSGYASWLNWTIGQSFANQPVLSPTIYDPTAPLGQRWSREGLMSSTVARMYHSSALLLPDGSVLVSGSNPNADYIARTDTNEDDFPTEYRTEIFYPLYFNERRPEPSDLPKQLSYGGSAFRVDLSSEDLSGNVENIATAKVVIIRPGFSTHALNMGQRYLELESTYAGYDNGTGTLHVAQLPPNPNLLTPGPALLFVVVNGVPSIGVHVMIGSGQLGQQPVLGSEQLPRSYIGTPQSEPASPEKKGTSSASIPRPNWASLLFLTAAFFL